MLSTHVSGMANTADSLFGVADILNNKESNNVYLSASASIFYIAALELGNLF